MFTEIIIIVFLLILNGLLSMSEIAFISIKKFKLEEKARRGSKNSSAALLLLEEPEKFLSSIQIGITLIGIVAGAYGGYTIAEDVNAFFVSINLFIGYSDKIAFWFVVLLITYFSLVVGELVPKSIALKYPEKIVLLTARFIYFLNMSFAPFVWFLSKSTNLIIRILGIGNKAEPVVTEEEVISLIESGEKEGMFANQETEMIKQVFELNDKTVSDILIPRQNVEWIDISSSNKEIYEYLSTHNYSRYIVCEKNLDNIIGVIEAKEFLVNYVKNNSFDLKQIITEPLIIPGSVYATGLITKFKEKKCNVALVVDEYGGTEGLVTLHDLVENIFGDLPEKHEEAQTPIIQRQDGSYLVDASTDIKEVMNFFMIDIDADDFSTLGGFIMKELGKIPQETDSFEYGKWIFEVIDMDGRRVDKVLVKHK